MPDQNAASPTLRRSVPAAEVPTQRSLVTLIVFVIVIAALYLAREIMVPITLAVLLSFVLAPLVGRLRRLGVWRVPSVLLAVVVALGVITVLGGVIGLQVAQLGREAPLYAYGVQRKVDVIRTWTDGKVKTFSALTGANRPKPAEVPKQEADPNAPKPQPVEVHQPDPTPFQVVESVAMPIVNPLASLFIVLVVAVFILMQMEDLRDRMIRLFGSSDLHRTTAALDDAASRLSRYFLSQLALNTGFGLVVGAFLYLIGVPSPALFGIMAGLFRFVPYVGAIGSAVLPLALAAAVDPGWSLVIETAAMFVFVELVTGQVLEPMVYGHSTGLSPLSVVLAAVFWAWIWGPVGLILSMPLTLCLVVLGRHVPHLEFLDVLLGDRPALTPAESFYQRMLAGDADEAVAQAEALLKDRTLLEHYDQVCLPGLAMAANDSVRGVLTEKQLLNLEDTIGAVVMDLAEHAAPETVRHPGLVLCVGARGPLDDAACTILAQVLAARGIVSRAVGQADVARGAVERLDVTEVRMICVSYLEAAGSFSALRYLVRRLRVRAPGVPVLVGLWQAGLVDSPTDIDVRRLLDVTGADAAVTTLDGMAAACVERFAAD